MSEQYVSITNYANFKGVTRQTVHRWINSGQVTRIYIDGKPFILLTNNEED